MASDRFNTYPPPLDPDVLAQQDVDLKALRAAMLVLMTYCNQLKAGTFVTKTLADMRSDFLTAWKSLP